MIKLQLNFLPINFKQSWQAEEFMVFESQLLPQGAKYTKIKEFKLITLKEMGLVFIRFKDFDIEE